MEINSTISKAIVVVIVLLTLSEDQQKEISFDRWN